VLNEIDGGSPSPVGPRTRAYSVRNKEEEMDSIYEV
jgi:hypothetical protein